MRNYPALHFRHKLW